MSFFSKLFEGFTYPFRKLYEGLKFLGENFGKAGRFLVGGVESFTQFAVSNFPQRFLIEALEKVLILELTELTNEEKREEFLGWAKKKAERAGVAWTENMLRALLEILVAKVKEEGNAAVLLSDVRDQKLEDSLTNV